MKKSKKLLFAIIVCFSHLAFSKEENLMKIPGSQMKACFLALKDFQKEESSPDLNNYTVQIKETKANFEVSFLPNLALGEVLQRGGRTTLGKEVHYVISKEKNLIIQTYFGR